MGLAALKTQAENTHNELFRYMEENAALHRKLEDFEALFGGMKKKAI